MLGEVIAAHEAPLAHRAGELLLPRVRPAVPGEFVRASKPPLAALPAATERLFSCKARNYKGKNPVSAGQ